MPSSEYELRSSEDVARRALALHAFLLRLGIERSYLDGNDDVNDAAADAMHDRLITWLEEEGVLAFASEAELEVIEAQVGELQDWQIEEGAYRLEALAVLMWALEYLEEIPSYGEGATEEEISLELPRVESPCEDFLEYAGLRAEDELDLEYRIAEIWSRRARFFESAGGAGRSKPFAQALEIARQAHERGLAPRLAEKDLETLGKPYFKLSEDEYEKVRMISAERLKAFNWLFEMGDNWDRTPSEVVRD